MRGGQFQGSKKKARKAAFAEREANRRFNALIEEARRTAAAEGNFFRAGWLERQKR